MGVNYWAILGAAIATFVFGAVWYTALSSPWRHALGKSEAELKSTGRPMPLLFAITFLGQLIMAWVLAGLMLHLAKAGVAATPRNGMLSGAFCWLGFVATTLAVNHGYQGARWMLTVIDGGYWLGVLLIQGLIIGWLGIR